MTNKEFIIRQFKKVKNLGFVPSNRKTILELEKLLKIISE